MEVRLRPLVASDATTFALWETDPLFCAHAGWTPNRPAQESLEWWSESISNPDRQLIRLLALHNDIPVGYVDLYGSGSDERELGYVIAPSSAWGQGLGTAAARAGLHYGFDTLNLRRIWAEAVAANTASVRVLRRLGMRETGAGDDEPFLGKPSHYVQFELSRPEWRHASTLP